MVKDSTPKIGIGSINESLEKSIYFIGMLFLFGALIAVRGKRPAGFRVWWIAPSLMRGAARRKAALSRTPGRRPWMGLRRERIP